EESADDLLAPRQLTEQVRAGEGDVQEEADPQVGAQLPEDARHELQLVVLHPYGGTLGGDLRDLLREEQVDVAVPGPPLTVVDGRDDEVVVQGPQGGVGETLVEPLEI